MNGHGSIYGGMILENKITLVTGASRGIGHAIALKLGQLGGSDWYGDH